MLKNYNSTSELKVRALQLRYDFCFDKNHSNNNLKGLDIVLLPYGINFYNNMRKF